jgi:GTP:adenosylcobinamide-phosphate guanylyltransferase
VTPVLTIDAVVLAGSRPGRDALLGDSSIATKALLPIGGRPMLLHVVGALLGAPGVGQIRILAQDSAALAAAPELAVLGGNERISFIDSGGGISASLARVVSGYDAPLLVTTADNVLLTPGMIAEFLDESRGSDVAVAMVARDALLARYPQSRRTWLKFRGGWWSGANLFRFGGRQVLPLLDFWGSIEQDRKKGLRIIAAFGPALLIAAVLRLVTIQQGVQRAARRFGLVDARVVAMREPEACIDADKPADLVLIEEILATRQAAAIA